MGKTRDFLIGLSAAVVLVLIFGAVMREVVNKGAAAQGRIAAAVPDDAEVTRSLEATVGKMRKSLPIVSQGSSLVAMMTGPGKRLTYESVVQLPAAQWTPEMLALRKNMAINGYCTSPDMSVFKDAGVEVHYKASDQQGVFIADDVATAGDCHK